MTPSIESVPPCPYCGVACAFGYGKCHCGCKETTTIISSSCAKLGYRKGNPMKFHIGHNCRKERTTVSAEPFLVGKTWCCLLPLINGLSTQVSVGDFERFSAFHWRSWWSRKTHSYYAVRTDSGRKSFWLAREILGLKSGDDRQGDHINHDTLNNIYSPDDIIANNLRIVTQEQNKANGRRPITNTSGFRCVSYSKVMKKWHAYIRVNGKRRNLGYFDTPEEAYAVYLKAAHELLSEYACTE